MTSDPIAKGTESMNPIQLVAVLSAALFVGMMICLEIGYRLGSRSSENTLSQLMRALV